MTDELESVQVIEPDNFYDNEQHTTVFFSNGAFACSCGETSETHNGFFFKRIPRLRHGCVVCGKPAIFVKSLDDYLCESHKEDYIDWNSGNPDAPRIDFLREQMDAPSHIEDYYNGF